MIQAFELSYVLISQDWPLEWGLDTHVFGSTARL